MDQFINNKKKICGGFCLQKLKKKLNCCISESDFGRNIRLFSKYSKSLKNVECIKWAILDLFNNSQQYILPVFLLKLLLFPDDL